MSRETSEYPDADNIPTTLPEMFLDMLAYNWRAGLLGKLLVVGLIATVLGLIALGVDEVLNVR